MQLRNMHKNRQRSLLTLLSIVYVLVGCAASRYHNIELYMQQEDWPRAKDVLERIVEENPGDGEAHLFLAEVYGELDLVHNMVLTFSKLRNISPKYEKAIQNVRQKYWIKHFNLGASELEQKSYDQASYRFELVTVIDSTRSIGYQKLGDAKFLAGRYHEAKKAYRACLNLDPDNLTVKNNLAEIYFIQKQFENVLDLSSDILRERPNDLNSLLRRAYAFESLNKFKDAEEAFLQILEINPTHQARTDLGLLYFRHGHYSKAIAQFMRALDTSEDKVLLYRYLGEANRLDRRFVEMAKWYTQIIESHPEDLMSWKNLAIAYEALGAKEKLAEARHHITRLERTN